MGSEGEQWNGGRGKGSSVLSHQFLMLMMAVKCIGTAENRL